MDAGDDVVELGKNFVRKIQTAVLQNVALNPAENLEIVVESLVQFADLFDLCQQSFFVQTMSLKRTLAVVGDSQVFQTEFLGSVGHFLQSIVPIAFVRVVVKCSAKILQFD